MWARLIKRALPKNWWNRAAPNVEQNSNTLARLDENDPTFKCLLDHAFAQFSNDLAIALDPSQPSALRITHADGAAAIRMFIEDLEFRRRGWNEDRIRQEREEKLKRKN